MEFLNKMDEVYCRESKWTLENAFPMIRIHAIQLCSLTLKKISLLRLRTSLKSKLAAVPSKDLAAQGNLGQ